jgi:hypothetical protein
LTPAVAHDLSRGARDVGGDGEEFGVGLVHGTKILVERNLSTKVF